MTYNGRAVLAEAAKKHNWFVCDDYPGLEVPEGCECVAYVRGGLEVLIVWTLEDTATYIVKVADHDGSSELAEGPLGLITARSWLEAPA